MEQRPASTVPAAGGTGAAATVAGALDPEEAGTSDGDPGDVDPGHGEPGRAESGPGGGPHVDEGQMAPTQAGATQTGATQTDVSHVGAAPTNPAQTEASSALSGALRLAVTRLARRLRQQAVGQITASQLSALASVNKHGPVSLGELAMLERVAPPSMTRIAGRLEESGLVERRIDTADRRVARVVITAHGAALLDENRTRRDLFLAKRLQELSGTEVEKLAMALPVLERLASEDA